MAALRQFLVETINMMRNPAPERIRRSNYRDSHRATFSVSLKGAIKIESCCRRYHRLPVAWCLNFSLKAAKFRSDVFGPKRHGRLKLKYHRLKSVVYPLTFNYTRPQP